jgi:hypothetical protein
MHEKASEVAPECIRVDDIQNTFYAADAAISFFGGVHRLVSKFAEIRYDGQSSPLAREKTVSDTDGDGDPNVFDRECRIDLHELGKFFCSPYGTFSRRVDEVREEFITGRA